jgi:hypothetical protein
LFLRLTAVPGAVRLVVVELEAVEVVAPDLAQRALARDVDALRLLVVLVQVLDVADLR